MEVINCKYVSRMAPASVLRNSGIDAPVGFVLEQMDGERQFNVAISFKDAKQLHTDLDELFRASGQVGG